MTSTKNFAPFAQRMQQEGLPDIVVKTFEYYYTQLVEGQTGMIAETEIEPVESLPDAEAFSSELADAGQAALAQTVLLKLNGGLGTSMGLDQAKSLLMVKHDLSFLDIIAQQAMQTDIPLVLMNSFVTRDDSLAALDKYPDLQGEIPLDFLQHKIPKITQADFSPVVWSDDPHLEWCPPGHGDIYTALVTSGMLDTLLAAGYKYAFVSNSDNLGAVMDTAILGHFVQNDLPFMMEVADRTEADKKGGHLAQRPDGQLILRESAQCPSDDMDSFQDVSRHKYFNTNNLWLNLPALKAMLQAKDNILGLPMIRNSKTVDPRDRDSTPVHQLETAMGSAIGIFQGAGAIRVPRTRFAPVKTTEDLLAIRSDAYILTDDYHIIGNPQRTRDQIVISLDSAYYKLIDDMEARFPHGAPSLIDCERLTVTGDVIFGSDVVLKGAVQIINESDEQRPVDAGAVIEGEKVL
ncbi:MAG TPA: UTP--glucose-1-phosphate uridylyltransferase [Anaerolineae bacterium]|nr:UTP--glucose-1-phosphate uridylyltransferase [Anaerolineae bacterium]